MTFSLEQLLSASLMVLFYLLAFQVTSGFILKSKDSELGSINIRDYIAGRRDSSVVKSTAWSSGGSELQSQQPPGGLQSSILDLMPFSGMQVYMQIEHSNT